MGNETSSVKKKLGRGVTARIEPCLSDQALVATTIVKLEGNYVFLQLYCLHSHMATSKKKQAFCFCSKTTVNFLLYFSFGMVMGHL